nr:MAG TPA: hypothetical protein [Caudoviricetes sp.]
MHLGSNTTNSSNARLLNVNSNNELSNSNANVSTLIPKTEKIFKKHCQRRPYLLVKNDILRHCISSESENSVWDFR